MLMITRLEAEEILETLVQAKEDPMLDEVAYNESIDILIGVLKQEDTPIELLL